MAGVSRTITASGPKASITRPSSASSSGAGGNARDFGGIELHHFGNQQRLARDAAVCQRRLHALIDEPLMGGMLIDDDDAVGGLRHRHRFRATARARAQAADRARRGASSGTASTLAE